MLKIKNEVLAERLKAHNFIQSEKIIGGKPYVVMSAPASGLIGISKEFKDKPKGIIAAKENQNSMHRYTISDGYDDFAGGEHDKFEKDMAGAIDMKPFLKAQETFKKTGIEQRLAAILRLVAPRRARKMSEHDGEWSYDRKWEIAPFAATTKKAGMARTLDVDCHVSISRYVKASEFNRYGAMAWAISNIVEKAGITTNITLVDHTSGIDRNRTINQQIRIKVKSSGQYMPAQRLACVFQTVFVRRNIFTLSVVACDLLGKEASARLGSAEQQPARIRFEKGKITLSPDVINATSNEIEAAIIAAIKGEV